MEEQETSLPLHLYRNKSPNEKSFEIVKQILSNGKEMETLYLFGKQLTDEERFRLKSEALAFKSTLLFKLVTSTTEEEMKKEIIENCKDLQSLDYYRAILADRIMLENQINKWSIAHAPIPKPIPATDLSTGHTPL